jgi:hypothetical protein
MTVKKEATQTSKKNTAKKDVIVAKKAEKEVIQAKKAEKEVKQVSNTQKCADMIIQLATDAKHTRQEIVQTVSDALTALSVVTVKTMLSDLHNAKYAKRYSATTIKTDRETKRVSLDKAIV